MNRVVKMLVLGALIAVAAAGAGSSGAAGSHRGGTLKLLAKAAGGTLDPQVNYTLQYWQLYQATYDGLLAFKKAGGNDGVHGRARPRRRTCRRRRTAARPGCSSCARASSSRTASR